VIHVPIRDFTDSAGVHWQVWSTVPAMGGVAGSFRQGWLTFTSAADRRRLAPIPPNWEMASDAELRRYADRATPVRPTPPGGVTIEPERGERG
jgi:hypothetical protein